MPESISAQVEQKLQSLQRWVLGGLLTMLLLGLITLGFVAWAVSGQVRAQQALVQSQQDLILEGKQAHDALSALRLDIQRRRDNLARFLREHPGPEPIGGVPRALLEQSLREYDATLSALASSGIKP